MSGVPDMGWSSRHGWGSRHGMGYQTQVVFQTWDDAVPDRWWGTRQGWVKKGNLSFSEFSNVRFNLTSRGFNLTSRKVISFTSRGNLTSQQSGIHHSLIFSHFKLGKYKHFKFTNGKTNFQQWLEANNFSLCA